MKDSFCKEKKVQEPPFPTFYPDPAHPLPTEVESSFPLTVMGGPRGVVQELDPELHAMSAPTIEYTEADAVDPSAALRRREVKKQAKAKR